MVRLFTSRQEVSDKNVLYTAAIRDTELVLLNNDLLPKDMYYPWYAQ